MPLHPRDLAQRQRRRRWVLYAASLLLLVALNRCAVACTRHAPKFPRGSGKWATNLLKTKTRPRYPHGLPTRQLHRPIRAVCNISFSSF